MSGTRVYVGGLRTSPLVEKDELSKLLEKYGRVEDIWIGRKPAGFAFVTFYDRRDAEDAVRELDGKEELGSLLRVEIARSRRAPRDRDYDDRRRDDRSRDDRGDDRYRGDRDRRDDDRPRYDDRDRGRDDRDKEKRYDERRYDDEPRRDDAPKLDSDRDR